MLNKIWFQKECTQILNVEQMRAMKELHHYKGINVVLIATVLLLSFQPRIKYIALHICCLWCKRLRNVVTVILLIPVE